MTQTRASASRPPTVGVFGGSFDPPHLGHSLLVSLLRAQQDVDLLVVAPVYDHPLGKGTTTPFGRRLAWVRAAMRMHGDFVEVTDLERQLAVMDPDRPSYSLRLLDAVAQQYPSARVRLVIGSDIVARGETERWHRWDRIEADYDPLIVPRSGYATAADCALPEVSSSDVRRAVAEQDWEAVRRRVPRAVADQLEAGERGRVWIIGRGHVARHAEPWLLERGHRVSSVSGHGVVDGTAPWPSDPPQGVWVLTSDGAVSPVAEALARADVLPSGTPVFHGAGARTGRALLKPLADGGYPVGSLHPICALRRERTWPSRLGEATFGLEGDPVARSFLVDLVAPQPWLDLEPLDASQRVAYHAACALAANHLSVIEAQATAVLTAQGHPRAAATVALRTLMAGALENLQGLGIPKGVTGPMSRGDTAAVQAHLDVLDPSTRALYRALSDRLAALISDP